MRVRGIGSFTAERLVQAGITTIKQLATSSPESLAFVKGIGVASAKKIIENANHLMTLERGLSIVLDHIKENFSKSCPKCGSTDMEKKYLILGPERRIQVQQCKSCKFYLPA